MEKYCSSVWQESNKKLINSNFQLQENISRICWWITSTSFAQMKKFPRWIWKLRHNYEEKTIHYLLLACLLSLLILVNAAAASSKAHDTLEVNRRKTSGSASCLPSPDVNLLMPGRIKIIIKISGVDYT